MVCLAIVICGSNCIDTLEYVSSKKLICLTPNIMGPGEIIVTTYSGGLGKCTVTFTGLEPERTAVLGKGYTCTYMVHVLGKGYVHVHAHMFYVLISCVCVSLLGIECLFC